MRHSRFAAMLLAGLLMASCSDAVSGDSMTAEEKVAFILFGVKDGISYTLRENSEEISTKRESASPLALDVLFSGKKLVFVQVEKQDDCRYNATIEFNNQRSGKLETFSALYDLSGLKSATLESDSVALETVEVTCPEDKCSSNNASHIARGGLNSFILDDRAMRQTSLTAAVDDFRQNICRGAQ